MAPGDHPLLGWETPRSLAIGLHRATRRARGGDLKDDGQWQADRHPLGGSAQQLGEKQRRREVLERVGTPSGGPMSSTQLVQAIAANASGSTEWGRSAA
jgi:hypothetical protein